MAAYHDDVQGFFQEHFLSRYGMQHNPGDADAHQGADFATYEPYYQFGYEHALEDAFAGRTYAEVRDELRRRFTERYPRTDYDSFEEAIRFAYDQTRRAAR